MHELQDIDLNLLIVFQAIFQQRQISAVAKQLGLSQPAVSNALARLRKMFDDELFVRTAQGMQPTLLAQQMAAPVMQALNQLQQALNQANAFDAASSQRQFTIAMTDVGEMYFMPLLVELLKKVAPQLGIKTVRAGALDLKSEMEMGRVDLAIGAFEDMSDSLFQRRLFKQNYVCMYRAGHPQAGQNMGLKEFLAAQHLIVSSMESPYDKINQSLERLGVKTAAQFTVPHFVAVPYIISTTDLLVTVPQKMAERAAQHFKLESGKPPMRLPSLQTNLFWHRRFHQDDGNLWLRNMLAKQFTE
ncbi:MAG: LysR family transcriptional regulator [Burkholderiaceae bacterium]|nr:LysR family transcriptional regulator [Burkholderiaceae bacterium]